MRVAAYPTTDAVTLLRAEHAVARLLAETTDLADSYPAVLRAIAETLGWEVAAAWEADPGDPLALRRVALWHSGAIPEAALEPLCTATGMPIAHGLPGRGAREDSEARMRAILEAALDCVVTRDERGCVVEFNPAAERTFGYAREDVVGREMAELIVPPRLREQHRQGLRRYLDTGKGVV